MVHGCSILIADELAIKRSKTNTDTYWDYFIFFLRRFTGFVFTVGIFALALFLISIVVSYGDEITAQFAYGVPVLLAIVKQVLPIHPFDIHMCLCLCGLSCDIPDPQHATPIPTLSTRHSARDTQHTTSSLSDEVCGGVKVLPNFLPIAIKIEGYERVDDVVNNTVGRVYLYKMFNLFLMLLEIDRALDAGTFGSGTACVETEYGKFFYNQILMDMFVVAASVILTSFGTYQANKYNEMLEPRVEFDHNLVVQNVIDLLYRQAMIWCGSIASPILCLWGSLMNFIIFNVQSITFLRTHRCVCTPPEHAIDLLF